MIGTTILFFGGDKLSLISAKPSVNDTFQTKGWASLSYSGIVDGEFVNEREIPKTIGKLLEGVRTPLMGSLVVSVPSCFCKVSVTHEKKGLLRPRKVNLHDIGELSRGGRVIYYKIDGGAPILDAHGHMATSTIEACVSHLHVDPNFLDIVQNCYQVAKKFKRIKYLPTALCEANHLIPSYIRDKTCVLISCKMFTTSIAVIVGDQLASIKNIDMGSAHMINDISIVKQVNYNIAKQMYDEMLNGTTAPDIVAIVGARLEDLTEQIIALINSIDRGLYTRPFYICGGHIDKIPTAIPMFESALETSITQLLCPLSETNEPDLVSRNAVVSIAISS